MARQINGIFPGELRPTTTVGGCIEIFENAWPNPEETIKAIEAECKNPESGLNWNKATIVGFDGEQNYRTNYDLGITYNAKNNNAVAQNVHNQMNLLLLATTVPYAEKHHISEVYHEGYNMLKYATGNEYGAHSDGDTASGRAISAIIYLNDSYEGGHVEFINFGIKIKPEPGMLLVFPSSYPYSHIAHPVTSGTKYALVTWLHDRPF